VDGDNLLHAARGRRDDGGVTWLLPELARWRPAVMRIVVALDGHAATGESSRGRAAHGVEYRYAGSRSADDLLIDLLSAQPFDRRAHSAVVSGDLALAERARRAGGLVRSVSWLLAQLAHTQRARTDAAASGGRIGRTRQGDRQRHGAPDEVGAGPASEAQTWRPGRGATRKRGNPRRPARRAPRG
jgi:hypothetical protein